MFVKYTLFLLYVNFNVYCNSTEKINQTLVGLAGEPVPTLVGLAGEPVRKSLLGIEAESLDIPPQAEPGN
jgi:hypothetical protein